MRFITFASVILISSTLNGCSKTGNPTPDAHSTSVRGSDSSKPSSVASNITTTDKKAEKVKVDELAANVKIDTKLNEVVSSKKSSVPNAEKKDSATSKKKASATLAIATDTATSMSSDALPITQDIAMDLVASISEEEPAVYEDPFPGLEVSRTDKYTPEQISEMKFEIKKSILARVSGLEDKELSAQIIKLIESSDKVTLNRQYIDKILYSNLERIIDLDHRIKKLYEKVDYEKSIIGDLEKVHSAVENEEDVEKLKILSSKIEGLESLLPNEFQSNRTYLGLREALDELDEIYENKIKALVWRQEGLNRGNDARDEYLSAEKILDDHLVARFELRRLNRYLETAKKVNAPRKDLEEIRKALKNGDIRDRDELVRLINERIDEVSVKLISVDDIEYLNGILADKIEFLKDVTELDDEQMKITHA